MKELLIVIIAAMMAEVVIPGVARWTGPKEEEADSPALTAAAVVAPEAPGEEEEGRAAPEAEGSAEPEEEQDGEAPESETARLADENEELKLIVGEKELELHRLRQEQ